MANLKVDSYEIFWQDAEVVCNCYDPEVAGESFQRDVRFDELKALAERKGFDFDEYMETSGPLTIENDLATIINYRETQKTANDQHTHPVMAAIINSVERKYGKTA